MGYYRRNGLCFAELGEVADSSALCTTVYRDGRCVCTYDQFYQPNMRTCIKSVAQINNSCTAASQCTPFGEAHCNPTSPRRCVCRDYAVEDPVQQLCVKRVGLHQFCTTTAECADVPNTECNTTNNTCGCKANYFEENETCKAGINAECSATAECAVENSECSEARAAAAAAAVRRVQETIEEEEEDLEKIDEADEITGLIGEIDAPKKKLLRKQSSVKIVDVDSSASSSPTFKSIVSSKKLAQDDVKTCNCKANFVAKNNKCLEVVQSYGDPCEQKEQCTPLLGDLASCDAEEGKCGCEEGAHYNFNKCNKKVLLGDTCKRVSECFVEDGNKEDVQCRNAKCQCGFNSAMDTEQRRCVTVATKSKCEVEKGIHRLVGVERGR